MGEASVTTADIEAHEHVRRRRTFLEHSGFEWWVARMAAAAFMLTWIAYNTIVEMIGIPLRDIPLPVKPLVASSLFALPTNMDSSQ